MKHNKIKLGTSNNYDSLLTGQCHSLNFNPIQDGLFRGCSRMVWAFLAPIHKIRHTNPTMMKLGTVIPYLTKIQKLCESCDIPLEVLLTLAFFHQKSANFATSRNPHIDWILIHNFYFF